MALEDNEALAALLEDHTRDVGGLMAESFAHQALLLRLVAASAGEPALRPIVLQAFDETARFVERVCLRRGYLTEAVSVCEHMRAAFTGSSY
jgi:hypothetical protein